MLQALGPLLLKALPWLLHATNLLPVGMMAYDMSRRRDPVGPTSLEDLADAENLRSILRGGTRRIGTPGAYRSPGPPLHGWR